MNIIKISATKARNNFFSLLEQVALGKQVIIEKDNEEIAILSPKKTKTNWSSLIKASKAVKGILKDDDLKDNPLRRPEAKSFLGRWDSDSSTKKS